MAACSFCGKCVNFGIKLSHSHRRSNRTIKPNIQKVRAVVYGVKRKAYACTKCLRSGYVEKAV